MSNIPSLTLNTNASMPLLGLGVYKATAPGEVEGAIATALDLGYRLIDTASAYKNEEGVGRGIRSSSVPRKELFITTKLWNTAQRIGDIDGAFQRSLDRLGLDYVDLYLIHWPVPGCFINSWQALERIRESGQAKAIGVSNFEISHSERKDNHTNIFNLFFFPYEVQHESDEDQRINVITDFECHQLGCHRRTDISTKDNGNRLWQTHQSGTYKADDHNGSCRTAL